MKRGVSLTGFGLAQLLLAAAAAAMIHAFPQLPEWAYAIGVRSGGNWGSLFFEQVVLVGWMLLVPCGLMGAAFPIATRLLQREDGGHATGFAYAVNTVGTIVGSLVAGFVLVPNLGVQGTHLAATILSCGVGLTALLLARSRGATSGKMLAASVAALVLAVGLAVGAPRWDPALMSAGAYRPVEAANLERVGEYVGGEGSPVHRGVSKRRVVFYREGINGSVLVDSDPAGSTYSLRVGGKVDASTRDMETQVLLGALPAALADSGARTLVIGLGSGVTAAAALAAGAGPTEVVEIEPGVVAASRFFHAQGENPLDDPRLHLILGDARTHLEHSAGRYGLIISEPSNPWIAGVNNLFTVDFYRRVRARLEPGGVFCQWMQLYELSPATFASMTASFLAVFPEGHLFVVWRAVDVLLVAAPSGRSISLDRLRLPAARASLARGHIASPEAMAGYYAAELSELRSLARGAPLNRDDLPLVEYRAPRDMVEAGRSQLAGNSPLLARLPFSTTPPAGALFSAWPLDEWYRARVRLLAAHHREDREDTQLRAIERSGNTALAAELRREDEATQRRNRAEDEMERGLGEIASGNADGALRAFERAVQIDSTHARAWLLLSARRRSIGDVAGADAALARGRKTDDPEVLAEGEAITGLNDLGREHPREAAEHFRAAQRFDPRVARYYLLEEQARATAGDPSGARAALERGLGSLPGDPEIAAHLAARPAAR
jgi:spermidine synthase